MLDYHVHLWPHDERADAGEQRIERLAAYCEQAAARGVMEIALTEHLFRFKAARAAIGPFWEGSEPALAPAVAAYWDHHATADLDDYVEAVLAAKRAGLPVLLGLEVDYYPGQMDTVERLLAGYPFDVLLGSVHWIGNWMFDDLGDEVMVAEWDRRGVEDAWRGYTDALEELAGTRTCDVLAHPDLVKLTGRRPPRGLLDECHHRMAEAARASQMAAEISSAGWRKPVGEAYPAADLLDCFFAAGVPVTTASDSHGSANVALRADELWTMAQRAGYSSLRAFAGRRGRDVPIDDRPTFEGELLARRAAGEGPPGPGPGAVG